MDRALIDQLGAFKKRALAQPTVEKRKQKSSDDSERHSKKAKTSSKPKEPKSTNFDYKTAQGSSQYKFSILAKIVKFMKERHQQDDTYPLALDEILDETHQLDIGNMNRHWLLTEALLNNPKIKIVQEDGEQKFKFNPKFHIKDRKALVRLLQNYDLNGEGGILRDDVEESLPKAKKAIERLLTGGNIISITRPNDKKEILYYKDNYCKFTVDEEFQKLWRGVSVEGQDERKIEEYLDKQGISSLQDMGLKKVVHQKTRRKGGKGKFKKLNEHLEGVLQDYGELKANKT